MKTKHLIPLIAGLGLLCACKGKISSSSPADTTENANVIVRKFPTADSSITEKVPLRKSTPDSSAKKLQIGRSHKTDTSQPIRRIVQKADIHFRVKSVTQTAEQIAALTADLKGSIIYQTIHSTLQSQQDFKRSDDSITRVTITRPAAEMKVKVPPPYLEVFLLEVARLGIHIDSSHLIVNDKTLDYLSAQLKLKDKTGELAERESKAETKITTETQNLKNNIIDERIKNLRLADSAKMGVISLSFYENDVITKEVLPSRNLGSYNESASNRVATSVKEGWDVFVDFIAVIIKAWVLLPLGFIAWLIIKRFNKTKTITNIKTDTGL
ncbi:MAG: DUF4349 domain-containing protein [Mucilaginibacter sp.]